MPLTPISVVHRTGGLMSTPLGQDIVILNPATDNYVGLDEIGRRVWDLLATPGEVKDLCLQVTREYQGDAQEITADLMIFLNELASDGLIDVAGPAVAAYPHSNPYKCIDTPASP
jgi:hypothetical protein